MLDGDGTAPPLSNLVSSAPDLRCWPHHHRPGSRSSRRSNLHGSKRSAPYTAAKSISPYNINGCNSRQMSAGTSEGGLLTLHELRQAKLVVNRDTCRSDWRWHTSVCVLAVAWNCASHRGWIPIGWHVLPMHPTSCHFVFYAASLPDHNTWLMILTSVVSDHCLFGERLTLDQLSSRLGVKYGWAVTLCSARCERAV